MFSCISFFFLMTSLMCTTQQYASVKQMPRLCDITVVNPRIRVDLVYARADNFTKSVLYPKSAKAYLLEHVAQALSAVQKEFETMGLGLLVYDAYRPPAQQKAMWDACPDVRYVAPPHKGGRHTRGTTVDLTLVNLQDGTPVEMPSVVDDFTEKAWRSYEGATAKEKENRDLLERVMHKHGFKGASTEWWHFDYADWQTHEPLNIGFDELM